MVAFSSLAPAFAAVFPIACYYLVRPIQNIKIRGLITVGGCAALIELGCRDLPVGMMSSVMTCSLYWMISIRLVHLMISPEVHRSTLSLKDYLAKFAWFFLPINRNPEQPRELPRLLLDNGYLLALAGSKVIIIDWVTRWLLHCFETEGLTGEIIKQNYSLTLQFVSIFFITVFCSSYTNDIQVALTSLLTLDRYRMLEFNNWPLLSTSLREFWGVRYNRLVNALLRESVFEPLHKELEVSKGTAALAAFGVSGLLHLHVAKVGFNGSMISAFSFFALHGLACSLETTETVKNLKKKMSKPVSILLTNAFLLATSPLYPGLFVYAMPAFLHNHPRSFQLPSALEIPIPGCCPRIL